MKDKQDSNIESLGSKCIDVDVICAHSLEGECLATHYDHLCPEMKKIVADGDFSELLGN